MTQNTPARTQQPSISVRRLPRTGRELPRWEVLSGDEATGWQVIGWIQEEHLRGARNPFFFAIGIHPVDHRHYRLEGNIDFDERVNTVADFHLDPITSRQHLGLETRH